ncbi:MAG: AAA family ATPase [Candidatus Paracaedibacteraceae bacterium]|nr:AAA family ATPase [Candidatus Paracaedibacteraceae bacterium]
MKFIGRQQELKTLSKFLKKKTSSMIVVQGRRRIGKSRLIEEFAKEYTFFQFSGIAPTSGITAQSQRDEFSRQLAQQTDLPEVYADDWGKLFVLLKEKLKKGRVIVLFDEISWMGSKDPEFLGKLKNAWDLYFKKNPELILFLCGSASAWIEKNILSSTGFMGRVSYRMLLEELSLSECNQFWSGIGSRISAYEKFKILSITGGVPRYLEEIIPSLSAEENIKDLCFSKGGVLVNEFEDIFSDLFFQKSKTYKKMVQTLSEKSCEMTEISALAGVESSGFLSEYLTDLMKSGFISRDFTWDLKTGRMGKLSRYRLSDNYLRFYLKYIEPVRPQIETGSFALKSVTSLSGWDAMMGLQFENLVLRNRHLIKDILNLRADEIKIDNPYFQRKTVRKAGCQIDYLIQTKFGGLYLCEIKFSRNPISTSVIAEVQTKLDALSLPKGTSCRPILIHVNGVTDELVDRDFFADIIDFSQFLG